MLKEFYKAIDSLDNNKAPSPGIFKVFDKNIFRKSLKFAIVSVVYKKYRNQKLSEHSRPITFTPPFAKLFERLL